MDQIIIMTFVFFVVLFVYIHVYHQYSTSNDFEVYEFDTITKDRLEEICRLKQPFVFSLSPTESGIYNTNTHGIASQYAQFELNIRTSTMGNTDHPDESVPLSLDKAIELFNRDDAEKKYYSDDNAEFLAESGLVKHLHASDHLFRPPMVCSRMYDVITGSSSGYTPLRYEINDRNYFAVVSGVVDVVLIPPKYTKYLRSHSNYDAFEFNSSIDVWNVQEKYAQEYKKSKSLQVSLNSGKVLYVPPYWWYSIRFGPNTSVTSLKYRTYMNTLAIFPYTCMHYLQMLNVKGKTIEHLKALV